MSKLDFALYGSIVLTLMLVVTSTDAFGAWPYALLGALGVAAIGGLSFKALRLRPARQSGRQRRVP